MRDAIAVICVLVVALCFGGLGFVIGFICGWMDREFELEYGRAFAWLWRRDWWKGSK